MHVVATAGHVDHGKSTLVRLLTGTNPDRWAEERRRGMTIDLGYAWMTLPSSEQVAFVDVPGHERFITNMMAGVGPVPAVLFVVAADDGWRAQSEEHAAALAAFGVRHLLLVITRCDLCDPTPTCDQALQRLGQHGLRPSDVVTVSGRTGEGRHELVAALDRLVATLPPPAVQLPTRLWIDRVFTIRGAGVVVTGTLSSGRIEVGEKVELAPNGLTCVVRGLESCKEKRREVFATARVAVNLRDAQINTIRRGDSLVAAGSWIAVKQADVELSAPLGEATMTLHVGSAAVPTRVRPLGAQRSEFARLTLAAPLQLRIGDRALLRAPGSPKLPVGVQVLDLNPLNFCRRGDAARRSKQLSRTTEPTCDDLVDWHGVLSVKDAAAMYPGANVSDAVRVGSWLVAPSRWNDWQAKLAAELPDEPHPTGRGPTRGDLVRVLRLPDVSILDALLSEVDAEMVGGRLRCAGRVAPWSEDIEIALAKIEARLRNDPFRAPAVSELETLALDRRIRGIAVEMGRLLAVGRDVYLLPDAVEVALKQLGQLGRTFTVSEVKCRLNTTRRVVVPLLEHLDRAGYTRRVDDRLRTLVQR